MKKRKKFETLHIPKFEKIFYLISMLDNSELDITFFALFGKIRDYQSPEIAYQIICSASPKFLKSFFSDKNLQDTFSGSISALASSSFSINALIYGSLFYSSFFLYIYNLPEKEFFGDLVLIVTEIVRSNLSNLFFFPCTLR